MQRPSRPRTCKAKPGKNTNYQLITIVTHTQLQQQLSAAATLGSQAGMQGACTRLLQQGMIKPGAQLGHKHTHSALSSTSMPRTQQVLRL